MTHSLAPDLGDGRGATRGSTRAQVIERHSALTYHVYMLGFLPGLAYMGDLPAELALPRREIAAHEDAGRLARDRDDDDLRSSRWRRPCGWHLIGRSPVPLWDLRGRRRALLRPATR